jgi:hypothetical protein
MNTTDKRIAFCFAVAYTASLLIALAGAVVTSVVIPFVFLLSFGLLFGFVSLLWWLSSRIFRDDE